MLINAPRRDRTCDLVVNSDALEPTELGKQGKQGNVKDFSVLPQSMLILFFRGFDAFFFMC